ncbi:MAG: hypothetical protein AMXMBFR7_50940 [Planctomycetota bacterium]
MSFSLDKELGRLGGLIARRSRYVEGAVLLLALCALPFAVYTLRHLDVNVFNQVDDSLKRVRYLRESSEAFGGDFLAAVIEIPADLAQDPATAQELRDFGDLLAAELAQVGLSQEDHAAWHAQETPHPWLQQVEVRAGAGLEAAREEIRTKHFHVALTPTDVTRMGERFEDDALRRRMEAFVAEYQGAPTDEERMKLRRDPLNLWAEVQQEQARRRANRRSGFATGPEGYFLSPDGTTLLILGRPVGIAQDLVFDHALLSACQRAENRAVEAFRKRSPAPRLKTALKATEYAEWASGEPVPDLSVGFTGLHTIAYESEVSMRKDILATTGSSVLAVLLLFLFVFRRMALALYIGLTMGLCILFTLAAAALVHGKIGVMGASFPCILLGMGVDYGIHLFSTFHAYREGEGAEQSPEELLRHTLQKCGPGILAAAATTVAAFFGIASTHFKGLAELGLLSGIGLLCAAFLMLTFFPALLMRQCTPASRNLADPLHRTMALLGRIHANRRLNRMGLTLGLILAAACTALVTMGPKPEPDSLLGVAFDSEFTNLRSLNVKAFPLRERIAERFGQGFTDIKVVVEGPDEARAFAASARVLENAQAYIQSGELRPSGSILDFLPGPQEQEATLERLRALDIPACKERFLKVANERFGGRAERSFAPFLERLDEASAAVSNAELLTLAKARDSGLASLLALYARDEGEGAARRVRLVLNFFPGELLYPESWYDRMAETLERDAPPGSEIRVSAPRMVGFELRHSLFFDLEWISGLVAVCVAILMVLTFRSLLRALWASVPLAYGFLFVLAGVTLAQITGWRFSLNYVNIMIFPLLLGTGIDYGVYLIFDAFGPHRPSLEDVVNKTGRSVLLCGLTTLAGFGSMILGSFTGLIGFGYAAILGYGGTLFGALIVLPCLLGVRNICRRAGDSARTLNDRANETSGESGP